MVKFILIAVILIISNTESYAASGIVLTAHEEKYKESVLSYAEHYYAGVREDKIKFGLKLPIINPGTKYTAEEFMTFVTESLEAEPDDETTGSVTFRLIAHAERYEYIDFSTYMRVLVRVISMLEPPITNVPMYDFRTQEVTPDLFQAGFCIIQPHEVLLNAELRKLVSGITSEDDPDFDAKHDRYENAIIEVMTRIVKSCDEKLGLFNEQTKHLRGS